MHYTIAQIPVEIFLGVPPEERGTKQEILVDVQFDFESHKAQKSDRINDTIDYAEVYEAVQKFPGQKAFNTVEYLYRELTDHLQKSFPKAENLSIRIQKFPFEEGWVEVSS